MNVSILGMFNHYFIMSCRNDAYLKECHVEKANIVECLGAKLPSLGNFAPGHSTMLIARVFWSDYLFSLSSQPGNEYYNDCGVQYQRYTLKECPAAKARLSNVL